MTESVWAETATQHTKSKHFRLHSGYKWTRMSFLFENLGLIMFKLNDTDCKVFLLEGQV